MSDGFLSSLMAHDLSSYDEVATEILVFLISSIAAWGSGNQPSLEHDNCFSSNDLALVLLVNFYLVDERREERAQIMQLCNDRLSNPHDIEQLLEGYAREAFRT